MHGEPLSERAFRTGWIVLLAAACAATQACGPADPLDMTVNADTYVSFSLWKTQARDRLESGTWADFEEALQEIRFRTMAQGTASGSDAVEEATRAAIDGRSVRYVLGVGLGWELARLQAERSELGEAMRKNAWLQVHPDDTDSAEYLRSLRRKQEARLQALDSTIAVLQGKLAVFNPGRDLREVAPTAAPAAPQPAAPSLPDSPPQRIGRVRTRMPASA